jgi:hypothetical protein
MDLIEVVDTPDKATLGVAPGAEVLHMEVADREYRRRRGLVRLDAGPDL